MNQTFKTKAEKDLSLSIIDVSKVDQSKAGDIAL